MAKNQRLLVVDDEEMMCEGCRRIFSRQGFQVDKTNDARHGLSLAEQNDYDAILLDIMMPNMTGLEFLEELRAKKKPTPVIFMTGYPTVPNAVSAIRLGAVGYVIKPFTPEEITQAVQKHVSREIKIGGDEPRPAPWVPAAEGFYFWNDSWLQPGDDGLARVGAMVTRQEGSGLLSVRLPRIGEAVYQGLPLAELTYADRPPVIVPAPVSGVVVTINDALETDPSALVRDPCGSGWIALVCPTRLEVETQNCTRRRVLLVNRNADSARVQQDRLTALGCQVRVADGWEDLASSFQDNGFNVLLLDDESFGAEGPALVERIKAAAPGVNRLLVAAHDSQREAAYRAHRIFYYAVEPFADNEIVDILDAAFHVSAPAAGKAPGSASSRARSPAFRSMTASAPRYGSWPLPACCGWNRAWAWSCDRSCLIAVCRSRRPWATWPSPRRS